MLLLLNVAVVGMGGYIFLEKTKMMPHEYTKGEGSNKSCYGKRLLIDAIGMMLFQCDSGKILAYNRHPSAHPEGFW